jgi:hypothetical protein
MDRSSHEFSTAIATAWFQRERRLRRAFVLQWYDFEENHLIQEIMVRLLRQTMGGLVRRLEEDLIQEDMNEDDDE